MAVRCYLIRETLQYFSIKKDIKNKKICDLLSEDKMFSNFILIVILLRSYATRQIPQMRPLDKFKR